jgi:acyl dehydratase
MTIGAQPNLCSWSEYQQLVGQWQGESDWLLVSQEQINQFAELTGDAQFIHVDPIRAAATPFGGTIAHGFLTLSLLAGLAEPLLPRLAGLQMGVNYGFDRIRFLTPVRSGKRIRAGFALTAATEVHPGQYRSIWAVRVAIEGEHKPALIADWITLSVC